jgi:hypothetical protein
MFYYKDKNTKCLAHLLDLQEYGVTKNWVIITEIAKEVENNIIATFVCVEIKTQTETVALSMLENTDDAGVRGPIFFNFVVGKE